MGCEPTPACEPSRAFEVCDRHFSPDRLELAPIAGPGGAGLLQRPDGGCPWVRSGAYAVPQEFGRGLLNVVVGGLKGLGEVTVRLDRGGQSPLFPPALVQIRQVGHVGAIANGAATHVGQLRSPQEASPLPFTDQPGARQLSGPTSPTRAEELTELVRVPAHAFLGRDAVLPGAVKIGFQGSGETHRVLVLFQPMERCPVCDLACLQRAVGWP